MAGQRESNKKKQDYIGDEPIADYITRMGGDTLKDPAVSNTLGFQKAVGAKQSPSFFDRILTGMGNIDPPDMPKVPQWLKDLFKNKRHWNKVGDLLSKDK